MFRFQAGRVEVSVPGWLMEAAATYVCIDYMELCAKELARAPDIYGYDPGNTYTVLVQTWDCALSATRSLAFGRDVVGHEAVQLIPDFYYIHHEGYRQLRGDALERAVWSKRDPTTVWRGSVTGRGPYQRIEDIPRVRMAAMCQSLSNVDVKLTGPHSSMDHMFSSGDVAALLSRDQLSDETWHMKRFGDFKYVIDIDGHANAWSFIEKLILGCCVLKVDSHYEQWFYKYITPWVHFVPVKRDLSNLEEMVAWCHDNEQRCEWIADNGARLAASLTAEAELKRTCETLLTVAHVSQRPR